MSKVAVVVPEELYCVECGQKLVAEVIPHAKHLPNYDQQTGRKFIYYQYRCPKARFWNRHTFITPDYEIDY